MAITAARLSDCAVSLVREPRIPYVLGRRSESGTDCINLVGLCVQKLGGLTSAVPYGSNTAWRTVMSWRGTLADAAREGKLVPGALVYVKRAATEKWPDGDYGHVGIYVGRQPGWKDDEVVVHASTKYGVSPTTLANSWNYVACLTCVDYSSITEEPVESAEVKEPVKTQPAPAESIEETAKTSSQFSSQVPVAVCPVCQTTFVPASLTLRALLEISDDSLVKELCRSLSA